MQKCDGFWEPGVIIRKFSSLPAGTGIKEENFRSAILLKKEDGSRILRLRLRGVSVVRDRIIEVPCPSPVAAEFICRARREAAECRAENRRLKAAITAAAAAARAEDAAFKAAIKKMDQNVRPDYIRSSGRTFDRWSGFRLDRDEE